MTVTTTSTQSWSSRVGNAFKGILAGILLVVVSVAGLFWNEGRTIKTAKALKEGAKNVVSVDVNTILPENEGKLIHVSGEAKTNDVLTDSDFNFSLNAIALERKVETYQWQEDVSTKTERTSGGGEKTVKTYSYSKVWSEQLIDSSSFQESGHDNPANQTISSQSTTATNVSLGAFKLPANLIDRLGPTQELDPNALDDLVASEEENKGKLEDANSEAPQQVVETEILDETPNADENNEEYLPAETNDEQVNDQFVPDDYDEYDLDPTPTTSQPSEVQLPEGFSSFGKGYYRGDPNSPQIGDVRVSFSYVPASVQASVVSQQSGDSFIPYQAQTGEVQLLANGLVSAEQMFENAQKANRITGWIIRGLGFLVMLLGVNFIFKPLSVIADIVPFAAKIVGFGTGVVAFCFSLFLSLATISVGWLSYRPFIGVPILILAIVSLLFPIFGGRKRNNKNEL